MSPDPPSFLRHFQEEGYHPRSNKHSNALAQAIVEDLLFASRGARSAAQEARLVYDLNFTIRAGTSDWNVDLVLGAPPPGVPPPAGGLPIQRTRPSTVQVAVEIKSVMTEHRKAIRNRTRDFEAHHEHVHRYNNRTLAAGVLVLNMASSFRSPLRRSVTIHRAPAKLVEYCIGQMRSVTERRAESGEGLEAKCVVVVSVDNQNLASAAYVTGPPAPPVGDPLHYDAFIQSLGRQYEERWLVR
jgi:hypothetical protein